MDAKTPPEVNDVARQFVTAAITICDEQHPSFDVYDAPRRAALELALASDDPANALLDVMTKLAHYAACMAHWVVCETDVDCTEMDVWRGLIDGEDTEQYEGLR